MILSISEYEKYLPNTDSYFNASKMEAFEIRALYKHFPKYIGEKLTDSLIVEEPEENLLSKAKPAIACLALLESVPFLDVMATNNGFAIVSNTNLAPASRDRVNSLREGCLVSANTYFDQLLRFLEDNAGTYADWNKSCINEGSLLPGVAEFIAATKKHCDRHAFVDMISDINAIENTALKAFLSAEFLAEMQVGDDVVVKPLLRSSLAYTVLAKLEEDKPEPNTGIVSKYRNFGRTFLHRALAILVENLDTYPTFRDNGYEKPYDNEIDGEEDHSIFIMGAQ